MPLASAYNTRGVGGRELARTNSFATRKQNSRPSSVGSRNVSTQKRVKPKPAWDSTIHDLSVHKLSKQKQIEKALRIASPLPFKTRPARVATATPQQKREKSALNLETTTDADSFQLFDDQTLTSVVDSSFLSFEEKLGEEIYVEEDCSANNHLPARKSPASIQFTSSSPNSEPVVRDPLNSNSFEEWIQEKQSLLDRAALIADGVPSDYADSLLQPQMKMEDHIDEVQTQAAAQEKSPDDFTAQEEQKHVKTDAVKQPYSPAQYQDADEPATQVEVVTQDTNPLPNPDNPVGENFPKTSGLDLAPLAPQEVQLLITHMHKMAVELQQLQQENKALKAEVVAVKSEEQEKFKAIEKQLQDLKLVAVYAEKRNQRVVGSSTLSRSGILEPEPQILDRTFVSPSAVKLHPERPLYSDSVDVENSSFFANITSSESFDPSTPHYRRQSCAQVPEEVSDYSFLCNGDSTPVSQSNDPPREPEIRVERDYLDTNLDQKSLAGQVPRQLSQTPRRRFLPKASPSGKSNRVAVAPESPAQFLSNSLVPQDQSNNVSLASHHFHSFSDDTENNDASDISYSTLPSPTITRHVYIPNRRDVEEVAVSSPWSTKFQVALERDFKNQSAAPPAAASSLSSAEKAAMWNDHRSQRHGLPTFLDEHRPHARPQKTLQF